MTITKADLIEQLKGLDDNCPLYVRTPNECMACDIVTDQDIIEEYLDKVPNADPDEENDVDNAIQELADFDDSIQFYEIN